MNCPEIETYVHKLLDGETFTKPEALSHHLNECPACFELWQASRLLQRGLPQLMTPQPSALLSARIVKKVRHQQQRQRTFRRTMVAAVAAVILLIVAPVSYHFVRPTPNSQANRPVAAVDDLANDIAVSEEPLRFRMKDARYAMASLTNQFASQTREQAENLLNLTGTPNLSNLDPLPEDVSMNEPLDPAAQSLQNAGKSVSTGFQTVANSARRAVSYFSREIPGLTSGSQ